MIYQENNKGLKWDDWYHLYEEITSIPFNFLNINYDNIKQYRFIDGMKEINTFE